MDIDLVVVACVNFPMIFIKVAICHVKILKKKTHHVIYLRIHYAKKMRNFMTKIIYCNCIDYRGVDTGCPIEVVPRDGPPF